MNSLRHTNCKKYDKEMPFIISNKSNDFGFFNNLSN